MRIVLQSFSLITFCTSLVGADARHTVTLTKLIKPFVHIQMHHNGITVPMLGLTIKAAYSKHARFVHIKCMNTESGNFNTIQIPRELVWSEDPHKNNLMPELKHHATGSQLFTKLSFDSPTVDALDYQVESFNESDRSQVSVNCIVHPNDTTSRECRIICENALDIGGDFNNQTFSRIHTLGIQATRLLGTDVLNTLCSKLPFLQHLYILNTELQDTTLALTHQELIHCEFAHTNLSTVTSLKTPLLRNLLLTHNEIAAFNTDAIGSKSFKLVFDNAGAIEKTIPYHPDCVKPLYIDLRHNPLKADAIMSDAIHQNDIKKT